MSEIYVEKNKSCLSFCLFFVFYLYLLQHTYEYNSDSVARVKQFSVLPDLLTSRHLGTNMYKYDYFQCYLCSSDIDIYLDMTVLRYSVVCGIVRCRNE